MRREGGKKEKQINRDKKPPAEPDSGREAICLDWLGVLDDRKQRPANTESLVLR